MASSAPIESSPPLRMWKTSPSSELHCRHLPGLPGSHQQVSSEGGQEETGRHLATFSLKPWGREAKLMMAFIVPGLCTPSLGMAEVSTEPGRSCEKSCHSGLSTGIPEAMISELRRYWLPIRSLRFSHCGLAVSFGGLTGLNAMWQAPQDMPIRKGGSIEGSPRWLTIMAAPGAEGLRWR